jgi:hypothetical protein
MYIQSPIDTWNALAEMNCNRNTDSELKRLREESIEADVEEPREEFEEPIQE